MRALSIMLIWVSFLSAQFDNSGTSAANFLKIGVGGRAAAMGGAIVGNIDGPNSMFWNPAGIANASGVEFSINFADKFHASLCDEERTPITKQMISHRESRAQDVARIKQLSNHND